MDRSTEEVAVIGAGSSGLAVVKALRDERVAVECFERGCDLGGMWRYEGGNGFSNAYASLRTNVSRARMQYPGFAMPESYGDFPHHSQMAAYLAAYAKAFGLRASIRFGAAVEQLVPAECGSWRITLNDGVERRFRAVVIATGVFGQPNVPTYPGTFDGTMVHAKEYRLPNPFDGRRVLVVGAGQSAVEIAVELATVAERTLLSVRSGAHVIPRRLGRLPYDAADAAPHNRLPWGLLNRLYGRRVAAALGSIPATWPVPSHRLLEGIPIVSSDLFPAVRRGAIAVKPAIARLSGRRVVFVDGSAEQVDDIVFGTGYGISLPFLSSSLVPARGHQLPLYRRIAATDQPGLFFAGFVDTPGGLLPVVEAQGRWIAAVLSGRLRLPERRQMRLAALSVDRRTRERFPHEASTSTRCDPHGYRRVLESDLRRVR